jgi:hypothetical protein
MRAGLALGLLTAFAAGCGGAVPNETDAAPTASVSPSPTGTPLATPTPTPTPEPTPVYSNEPDDELAGLIPEAAAGVPIIVAPFDEFALTPGDIGAAYGEIGLRFRSLVLAYAEAPRTTLYAIRVEGPAVATADLEPHLATAGRYVGIAGLDPEPWVEDVVGGNKVWTRPEDNATAAGTHLYTWSSGEYVFLLIGVDDAVNRAIVEQLPGEPAPTPRPSPSASADASAPASVSPSASPES